MNDFRDIQNPFKHLDKSKLDLCLSKRIANSRGLTGAKIQGKQQTGKSSYAMIVMWELYEHNVDDVLSHIVFTMKDLAKLLNDALQNGYKHKCILWDDASVGGSASHYNTDQKLVQHLSALGDTMGLATQGLLLTSPSSDFIKAFRQYQFYKVVIGFGRHQYDRIARGYTEGLSPMGQKWCSCEFEDLYDTRIPWYQRYYELRKNLSISTLKNFDAYLNGYESQQSKKFVKHNGKKYANIELDELN